MTIFGFAKYLALRLIQQPSVAGGPKPYAPNAGNVFFALFAAVGMVGAVGFGFNTVLRGPISAMTETTKRTVAESTIITSSRLAIVGATTQQADAGDTDNDGYIEPVPYRDAGGAPHPTGGGYLPTALNIPNTIDPWNTEYGYCAWDHGSVTASSRRLAGSPNNNRYAIAIISAGKDKRFQTSCVAYVDDTTTLIQMTPGSDDIVLAYTYAEANNLGNGLWKPHGTAPNTATTDRNIDVTGSGLVSGSVVLSGNTATGGGLILPSDPGDDSISGACNAANDNQLRYNVSNPAEPPVIEICDNGGLGWSPISGGAGGGGGNMTGQLVAHYKFDESTGTTAADETGNHNGTLVNNPVWSPGQGRADGALRFIAANTTDVVVPRDAALEPSSITIAAWIRRDGDQPNFAGIISKQHSGHYTSYDLQFSGPSDTQIEFVIGHGVMGDNGGNTLPLNSQNITIDNGVWYHVVATYTPSEPSDQMKLYINGQLNNTQNESRAINYGASAQDLHLGSNNIGSEYFNGSLDDVRIYNYGMTDEEVMELYSSVNPSRLNLDAPMKAGEIYSWGVDTDEKLGNSSAEAGRTAPGPIASTDKFIDVSGGSLHACGVASNGTVWCWGSDTNGKLGNGAGVTANQETPYQVSNLTNIVKISAGEQHTCALRNDGAIFCWGLNTDGQLGDGTTTTREAPVQVSGLANAIDISAGMTRTCAVVADGGAWCWGLGTSGQLGNGLSASSSVPVQVSSVTDFTQISVGRMAADDPTCGVTKTGKAYCWGDDTNQQLGNGAGAAVQLTPGEVTNVNENFSKISVNDNTVCAIVAYNNNSVACWGAGGTGQIGHGSTVASVDVPTYVSRLTGIIDIAVNNNSVCAVEKSGSIWCWGEDHATYGRLGNGDASTATSSVPVLAKAMNAYKISGSHDSFYALIDTSAQYSAALPQYTKKMSSAGSDTNSLHTCHIRSDGTMWCWGVEHAGELGNGGGLTDTAGAPVRVTDPGPWMSVTTGIDTTCGIKTDGTAWCWGSDSSGQLGNGATAGSQATPSPVSVADTIPWIQLSAGYDSTCGIKADGSAFCWGADSGGQLGNGAGGASTAPGTAITSTLPWIQISQGGDVTCGIKSDNTLWCWGDAADGRLGNGTTTPNLQTPALVGTDTWRFVEATGPCGIKTDGSLWCWGQNINGKLGVGSTYTGNQTVPRLVVEPGPWASVKAGSYDVSCGVKMDGTGWCWGDNTTMLGIGSVPAADVPYPVPVIGKEWVQIDGGGSTLRCGVKNDDSVWCWGNDFFDVLGNGPGNAGNLSYPQKIYQPYKSSFSAVDATTSLYAAAPAASLAIGTAPLTSVEGVNEGLSFPGSGRSLLTKATAANQFQLQSFANGGSSQIWLSANNYPYYMGYSGATGGLEFGSGNDWLTNYMRSSLEVAAEGFVGIGTGGAPVAKLDVRGAIKVGDAGGTCNGGLAGTIKYASGTHTYCNGSAWVPFGMSSAPSSLVWDTAVTAGGTSQSHRCAIKSNGTLWCGGEEYNGELGNGGSGSENTGLNSVQVGTDTWRQASKTCAIRSDGTAWCWGEGSDGQLGNNANADSNVPVQVANDSGGAGWSDWVSIASNVSGGYGIRSDGSAWYWGGGNNRPVRIPDSSGSGYWTDWKQISPGSWNLCGIRSDGSAWCWGADANIGICGNGTWGPWCSDPTQVRNTANTGEWYDWVTISASEGTACGIRANGEAYCWGTDYYSGNGYLGHGSTTPSNTPQKVHDTVGSTGFNDWVSIETGTSYTCGVRATGQVYCWGNLGFATHLRPFLMSADSDWIGVYKQSDRTYPCFSRAGGRMFCLFWGDSTLTEILP